MNELLKQIRNTVRQHELIEAGDSVVVGFSGGPDSLCLLEALRQLREELGIRTLAAVHVNHMYRGEAADRDEDFCEAYCRERGILFRAERADVERLAKEWKVGTEEAGRKVRYSAFARMAEGLGGAKIAVAHNREDQGETLFLRIVRGTGTAGLCGIDYKRKDGVIRPLLDCSRKDIEAFLEEEGLTPCIDHTNLEPVYTRNAVRLQVIPYINEKVGGDLTASLAKLSKIAREDRDFIEGFVEEILKKAAPPPSPAATPPPEGEVSQFSLERPSGHLLPGDKTSQSSLAPPLGELSAKRTEGAGKIVLPRQVLADAHPAVMKRAIVKCFERAGLLQDITSDHLDRAAELLRSGGTTWEAQFPHGYVMKRRYEKVTFEKEKPMAEDFREPMPEFSMRIPESTESLEDSSTDGLRMTHFDLDKIRGAGGEERLVMRTRRPGDVISPKGFSGTKKLQNYFVDRKIDRDLRDKLPLLCLGNQVLWIPGYEINEKFRVNEGTEHVLIIEMKE